VKVYINGEARDIPDHLITLADLATWLDLPAFGSAVELNDEVIRRLDHPATPVKDGDRLEVVRLVGGG
jgi:thiamine biosynthesis protein ThiS